MKNGPGRSAGSGNISGQEFFLRLAAPYLAVGLCWFLLHSAWLAILVYHAQILWWARGSWSSLRLESGSRRWFLLILPSLLAGPLLFVLLPHITRADLAPWLTGHGLSGAPLLVMIPYFGLVHPLLEQVHWVPLRRRSWLVHPVFAGYHLLVLGSLLEIPWLVICFGFLWGASQTWQRAMSGGSGLLPVLASHLTADLGIVLTAWILGN